MKYGKRIYYTEADKELMWIRQRRAFRKPQFAARLRLLY